MKPQENINDKIFNITNIIKEKYPELMKYISEMPETIPNVVNKESMNQQLEDYYESLVKVVEEYKTTHPNP
jgi:hypothetical protein